jgi:AbrB family looped-hinge helix DNA binding protein
MLVRFRVTGVPRQARGGWTYLPGLALRVVTGRSADVHSYTEGSRLASSTSMTVRTGFHDRGSIRAMRTTIDRAGRLVIPRSLRDRIGLAGGGDVEIELDGAAIRIEPVAGTELREDGGLLVIPTTGTSIDDTLVRELIDADRHGR